MLFHSVYEILFGSDFPVLGQRRLLRRVREAVDDEGALRAILWDNAARFYGLAGEAAGR